MTYYITKGVHAPYDSTLERVITLLKEEGFGIITEIDVKDTLKKKLGVDFRKYKILGACNPAFAHKALEAENKIGTMLPCNVIVQELSPGETEVSAINPLVSMQAVGNPSLSEIAKEIASRLQRVVENV
jgi:uncharacterized protein (DUF302 family)